MDVSVTAPTNNSTYSAGTNVTVTANATHKPGGSINSVRFVANGQLIGTALTAPYTITWNNPAAAIYSVTAIARDSQDAEVTSSPIQVKISKALKSVRSSRRSASTVVGATRSAVAATGDYSSLAADIEQTYRDFQLERAMFPAANRIDNYLFASLFLARATASLAQQSSQNTAISDRLDKLDAYLGFCEDLMVSGVISGASLSEASQVNAKVNLTIFQPTALSPTDVKLSPDGVGMIMNSPSPFASQILNAPNGAHSFELGGISITIKGESAEMLSVSPTSLTFKVPADLTGGLADILITSRGGYISFSSATVVGLNPTILFNSENLSRGAILDALNINSGTYSTVTPAQYLGLDARTRLSILATGISSGVANTDLGNDVWLANGQMLPNLAESVVVEARRSSGAIVRLPVEYAGSQGVLPGLDQITVVLPVQLAGAGSVQLTVVVGNVRSNPVTVVIQ